MLHPFFTVLLVAEALYGVDIETDTSVDGLDPAVSRVLAVALSSEAEGDVIFTGEEAGILAAVDHHLSELPPGILVSWNGAAFDLPFLADRARWAGVELGLELKWDGSLHRPGRLPLPGHAGAYRARWYGHAHLDAYRAWRSLSEPDVPCGLKAVARKLGLDVVDVDDKRRIHAMGLAALRRYVASDATLARRLAALRWPEIAPFVDVAV